MRTHSQPVGHQPFGQIAEAEVLGLEVPLAERFTQVLDRLVGTIQLVPALKFSVTDRWHGRNLLAGDVDC